MLALSTGSLYTYGLDRVFGLAKEAGFDGIEVAEFLRRLNQNGYKGIVTLESPPEALGDGEPGPGVCQLAGDGGFLSNTLCVGGRLRMAWSVVPGRDDETPIR